MSRETVCFSMYSDMSMRTIACSVSKRNSASALASSVFPTPVGPRKRKLPSGRLGSLNPARARRTAFATASTASSCPTSRRLMFASMFSSFCFSPSSSRLTGMWVQREMTFAMSSSLTSSFSSAPSFWTFLSSSCQAEICFSSFGSSPYLIWAARSSCPRRVATSSS